MEIRSTTYKRNEPFYNCWMKREGLPVITGQGIEDVKTIERKDWARTGQKGAFIDLHGMEGVTGMYVGEIRPGEQTLPQKHLYQQLVCILQGRGAAEVWLPGDEGNKISFEWKKGSLFAIPLNCGYQMYNVSNEPAIYLAVTDAPILLDLIHNEDFIFNNDYRFMDRFSPQPDYFDAGERYVSSERVKRVWETNLIPDVGSAVLDLHERKGVGARATFFEMAGNSLVGHIAQWPVGLYHKAHHHGGGDVLLIIKSKGYTLMWPKSAGEHPYRNGTVDKIVRVDWREGAVFVPPTGWYHLHFNTGDEPARYLAFRYDNGILSHPVKFHSAHTPDDINGIPALFVSYRLGGNLIEYEDEDPQFRKDYELELQRNGVTIQMPSVIYRNEP